MAVPIPDFTALAGAQGAINQNAANAQTQANRPNQSNPYGSLSWQRDSNGNWYQNQQLSGSQQGIFDNASAGQAALTGAMGSPVGAGSQAWGDPTVNNGVSGMPAGGFGAAQNVIDAYKALQEPGLTQNRDAERSRLAAMGITLGSDASNASERNLGNIQTDADNKAILAGTTEYGNVFNRDLALRQQGVSENQQNFANANALRGLQTSENINRRASDASTLGALGTAKAGTTPGFASFTGATALAPPNVYQAGMDQYNAGLAQDNAGAAADANHRAGNIAIGGAVLNGLGGVSGIVNGAKNAYNWASNLWSGTGGGGYSGDPSSDLLSGDYWY